MREPSIPGKMIGQRVVEVTPDSGLVHNPFGGVSADVEVWADSKLVRAVRLWT